MSITRHWIALRPERTTIFAHSPAVYTTSDLEAERFRANGWEIIGPLIDDAGAVGAINAIRELTSAHAQNGMAPEAVALARLVQSSLPHAGGQ